MPPILLCWSTTSEADVGGMAVEVEPSLQYPISFVAVRQMAAGRQSDKMAYCMTWKCVKSRRVSLNSSIWKKNAPIDIHRRLLNVYLPTVLTSIVWSP